MKAGSNLLNAVSAIALSAGIAMTGAGVVSLATATVAEAAVISRVDVRGNSRVDASTIRGNLTITPGDRFDNNDIDDSVKRLFATGLFADVRNQRFRFYPDCRGRGEPDHQSGGLQW
jgi:outer membrane protein insertion porin family